MNDTAIVTCFYTNLHGTKYGGRSDREHHYLHSLASLLKITNADFIIYCDPLQEPMLKAFIEPIAKTKVTIYRYSLEDFYMKELFAQYKDFDHAVVSQRCQEIQYLKSYWMNEVEGYDWVFWIDAGISYSGLIPYKHMITQKADTFEYYNSVLYCNDILNGMKKAAADKFLMFAINNNYPVWYRRNILDGEFHTIDYHAIAGILGGKINSVKHFHKTFDSAARDITETLHMIYDEESIYQIMWDNNPEFFNIQKFEMWWHEDNINSIYKDHLNHIETEELVKNLKSFYNVLEDLLELGKEP